jgi:hypothetical protein
MTPLEHYAAVKDQLETRIDAIGTIFALMTWWAAETDIPQLVTDALLDLGCDRTEITIAREKAGA